MNPAEYETMYRVETEHWWYHNLHALVNSAFQRYAAAGARVLDAGCGTGAVMARLADRYRVIGLDYSPLALQFTRSRLGEPLLRGSIAQLPFSDAAFDAVLSLDVVSHAGAGPPPGSIGELARVTKPGGYVVLNLPAYDWLRSPHDVQVQTGYRFTRRQVKRLLQDAGLDCVTSTYWNTFLMPAVVGARVAKRILRSNESDLADYRPGVGASICGGLLALERGLIEIAPLPFGVSIFTVARRRED